MHKSLFSGCGNSRKMASLSNPPPGFEKAIEACNRLPDGLLAEMCYDVMAFLTEKAPFICTDHHELAISASPLEEPKPSAKECVDALTHIYRCSAEDELSAEDFLSVVKGTFQWRQPSLAAVYHVWKEGGPALIASVKERALSVGQLVGMEWKLGVSMSSNYCKSLGSPHVSLQLKVAGNDGQPTDHSMEMSIPQFQNFAQQLREMAAILDTTS